MRFYRVLERVRDQIQRKYFCERVFRLHQDTTRRDTLEWMTDSTSYTLTDKFLHGGPTNRPLVDDERGLGRGANSEGIIKGTSTSLEGGACGFTCIDKAAVSAC